MASTLPAETDVPVVTAVAACTTKPGRVIARQIPWRMVDEKDSMDDVGLVGLVGLTEREREQRKRKRERERNADR